MPRLPHYLDSRVTDGGKVVRLTHRPLFTPQEDPWYSFLLEAESTPGHSAAGRIRSTEKANDLTGNRTRDLPVCSIVPQLSTLPRAPLYTKNFKNISDLKFCEGGILIQLLCFWMLYIVLFVFETHDVSET
jgi:hypothetical protein